MEEIKKANQPVDSKIPEGPVAEKWTNYKAHQKLVNPANKRRLDVIVVGTGLAGASAASTLAEMGFNIIVERESLIDDECEFAIGKIDKVLKTKVLFKHFDADGIWQDDCYEIPYSQITSVTFASRYVDVFSKYV